MNITTKKKIKYIQEKTATKKFKPQGHQELKSLLIEYKIRKYKLYIPKSDQIKRGYKK